MLIDNQSLTSKVIEREKKQKVLITILSTMPANNLTSSIAHSSTIFEQFVENCKSNMLRFKLVSHSKVVKLLTCLSNSKATDNDNISGRILKLAAPAVCQR